MSLARNQRWLFRVVLAIGASGLPSAAAQEVRQVPQLTVVRLADGERPAIDGVVSYAFTSLASLQGLIQYNKQASTFSSTSDSRSSIEAAPDSSSSTTTGETRRRSRRTNCSGVPSS